MIAIKLREAMEAYRRRMGKRMTYALLAKRTGLAFGTIGVMGSQRYNATLNTIEKICRVLEVTPGDLLELMDDPAEEIKTKSRKTTKKKRLRSGD